MSGAAGDCVNRKDCDTETKKKLMMELHDLIRGKAKQVSLTLPVKVESKEPETLPCPLGLFKYLVYDFLMWFCSASRF